MHTTHSFTEDTTHIRIEGLQRTLRMRHITDSHAAAFDSRNTLPSEAEKAARTYVEDYGASHLEFLVYCFTRTTEWVKYQYIRQDVLLKIMDIVTQHGAEFAFPTRTLHIAHDCDHEHEHEGLYRL